MNQRELLLLGVLAAVAIGAGGYSVVKNTRGFRNNNPGNLRGPTAWNGRIGTDPDGFAVFSSMTYGVRALRVDLTAKMNRGLSTVADIITTYAPPSENPTATYIDKVSGWMGVSPYQRLTAADLPGLVDGIIRFEQGGPLQAAVIKAGLALSGLTLSGVY